MSFIKTIPWRYQFVNQNAEIKENRLICIGLYFEDQIKAATWSRIRGNNFLTVGRQWQKEM